MTIVSNPLLLRKKAVSGENLGKSLRFNSVDSTYLNKTPSNAGNRKTWTWAGWVKRSNLGSLQMLFTSHVSGNDYVQLFFNSDDTLRFDNNNSWKLFSTALYRDVSAWMHVVCAVDTTLATADDRIRLFVNGRQLTAFGTRANPSQNAEGAINKALQHSIGSEHPAYTRHFDGYLADVHFIDGLALSPAAFGSLDSTGVFNPTDFALPNPNDGTTWSSGGTTVGNWNEPSYGVGELFDGNITSTPGGACNDSSNFNGARYTLPSTITVKSQVRVFTNANDDRWGFDIGNGFERAADLPTPIGSSAPYIWTLPTTTEFKGISCSDAQQIFGIEVDGVVLKDGQTDQTFAQWQAATSDDVNSFHLKFADVSSDAALGTDSFGNGTWTVSGLSVSTASDGINLDAFVDHPSTSGTDTGVGGEVRSNYATWNPLHESHAGKMETSKGNLISKQKVNWGGGLMATMGAKTGKWYYELTAVDETNNRPVFGIVPVQYGAQLPGEGGANSVGYRGNGGKRINTSGGNEQSYGDAWEDGDIIGVALDCTNGAVYFSRNGTWQASGVPTSGASRTNACHTWTGASEYMIPAIAEEGASTSVINFGQRAFKYTAPTDYKCLCTANFDNLFDGEDSENDPSKYFDAKLYTGNGGTLSLTGLGFSPDFVWLKKTTSGNHVWWDQVRGVQKRLIQNGTSSGLGVAGETTETDGITHFTSDGWTTGANSSNNDDNAQYCSFNWDLGTGVATASTSGSINPSVQWKNTLAGFSVSKYTGTGSSATIGHGLGKKPDVILCKNLARSDGYWFLYHSSLGATKILEFNSNPGESSASSDWWDNTEPTSDVFTVNVKADNNADGDAHVAYCWAAIPGYSAFGKYTGNGSSDGVFVHCGFKPAFVYIKGTHASDGVVLDNARSVYNVNNLSFHNRQPDGSATDIPIDFLSNGFKNRSSHSSHNSSQDFVYWAFAEHPLKTARAR